jgi:hypothetical protein
MRRALFFVVPFVALVALPRQALATPTFPEVIAQHLGLATAPDCTLCHNGTPGTGTVTTPFGKAMRSRGVHAYDEDSVVTALDALAAEKTDSDGDGVPDIDELKAGTSPNGGSITPEYGCALAPGAGGPSASLAAIVVAASLLAARRRPVVARRRKNR